METHRKAEEGRKTTYYTEAWKRVFHKGTFREKAVGTKFAAARERAKTDGHLREGILPKA